MAQTITEIAIIIVLRTSIQSLFYNDNSNVSSRHSGSAWHEVMFMHPHGTIYIISRATLKMREKKVKMAQPMPTFPIFSAMVTSFF
jgi:hypothetical protein